MNERRTVLDLPIEEQRKLAERRGISLEAWREREHETERMFAEHKITGYFDEETSRRFQAKMLSGTPT